MQQLIRTAFISVMVMTPGASLSQTAEEPQATTIAADPATPIRPDDEAGDLLPSDGLAECASILAVGSTTSKNFVQRKNMENASAAWFAASGDLASQEGEMPEADLWGGKVKSWTTRIGSVDGMTGHTDWMAYCAAVGQQHGLDVAHFQSVTQ